MSSHKETEKKLLKAPEKKEPERKIPKPPQKKESPTKADTEMWLKWAKANPQQAAKMIKDWMKTEEGG